MPANLSGMWILASYKILRCLKVTLLLCFVTFSILGVSITHFDSCFLLFFSPFQRQSKPALVVSWHCNIVDYIKHFSIGPLRFVAYAFFFLLFGMLPMISDRVLTPTRKSEPHLVRLWKRSERKRAGVCITGVDRTEFSPAAKDSKWGRIWAASKEKYLLRENKKHLLVCVGRLSPEKGVDGEDRLCLLRLYCSRFALTLRPALFLVLSHKNSSRYLQNCRTAPCGLSAMVLSARSSNVLHASWMFRSSFWATKAGRHFIPCMQ